LDGTTFAFPSHFSLLTTLCKRCTVVLYVLFLSEGVMPIQTTYTQARANLATLLDTVTDNREVIIIQRRGADDVALIAADELTNLLETAHLLRSPANAERLLAALARARQGSGTPQSIAELRHEVGLGEET
jgi:antitoxin YefM